MLFFGDAEDGHGVEKQIPVPKAVGCPGRRRSEKMENDGKYGYFIKYKVVFFSKNS